MMKFIKGMCAGMIVGAGLGMMMAPEKKQYERKFAKAMKTMKNIVEDIGDEMGF